MKHLILLAVMIPLASSGAIAADEPAKVDLPVTRVVLFSSGVGYFEHSGQIDGSGVAQLRFKTDQINDVLKSMVLMDLGGGTVRSVGYGSKEPLDRALKSFGVDVSNNPSLASVLRQLRGAEVTIITTEKIEGRVLSIETRHEKVVAGGTTTLVTRTLLNIVTGKGVRTVTADTIRNLSLKDQQLSSEMNKALQLLIEAHDTARKPVDIRFDGKGKRDVRIGYIIEAPVWKTSYRLDLSGDTPLMQGWAIVENPSEQDWKDVRLSLVSGRPISFIQDLYTPLYIPRPVVRPQLYASLRPQRHQEGLLRRKSVETAKRRSAGRVMDAPEARAEYARAAAAPAEPVRLNQGVSSAAAGAKLGELFSFTITDAVHLPRRRSSMLPIVNAKVTAEKVSIYNQRVLARHPLNGAWLTNDTGMKLPGGPITVFDGGSYAGDALIDNLAEDDKRLLSYGIDLNVTVDPSSRTSEVITGVKIVRGVLEIRRLRTYTQDYVIKNKAKDQRTLVVEHPFAAHRKLVKPDGFEEKTSNLYRFKVPVDAGKTRTFTVVEEQTLSQGIALLRERATTLLAYMKTGKISPAVRDALAKAAALRQRLDTIEQTLNRHRRDLQNIKNGQDRLRRNLASVGRDSDLGRRYLDKLAKEEDQIEKLEGSITQLQKQQQAAQKALADYVNNLNIE